MSKVIKEKMKGETKSNQCEKLIKKFTWDQRTSLYVLISLSAIVNFIIKGSTKAGRSFKQQIHEK